MESGQILTTILLLTFISGHFSQSLIQIKPENHHHHSHNFDVLSSYRKIRLNDNESYCDSWRLSVETNNAGAWSKIPDTCLSFVQDYMSSNRYLSDSVVAAVDSIKYARTVTLTGCGKDAWVFDVDETLLSHLPYFEVHGFISETFNITSWNEWIDSAEAPALPASLSLYKELQDLGFAIFLLTGRSEYQRNVTMKNLLNVGYNNFERLILRGPSDQGTTATAYKSMKRKQLQAEDYKIHGSSGDQWSDLIGYAVAQRSFKVPNPMYYVP